VFKEWQKGNESKKNIKREIGRRGEVKLKRLNQFGIEKHESRPKQTGQQTNKRDAPFTVKFENRKS
jgi:hypothetical protein